MHRTARTPRPPRLVWAAIAVAVASLACTTPVTPEVLRVKLRAAATSGPGVGPAALRCPVHAASDMAAWTLIAESRTGDPPGARRLRQRFRLGVERRRAVVVGGPYDRLTRQIVLEAAALAKRERYPGLTVVYVGEQESAREVGRALARLDVRFHHRDLP